MVPIVVLTYIHPTEFVLFATALFAISFAVTISVASRAKHHETFALTVMYISVLIAFVGNALQSK